MRISFVQLHSLLFLSLLPLVLHTSCCFFLNDIYEFYNCRSLLRIRLEVSVNQNCLILELLAKVRRWKGRSLRLTASQRREEIVPHDRLT